MSSIYKSKSIIFLLFLYYSFLIIFYFHVNVKLYSKKSSKKSF